MNRVIIETLVRNGGRIFGAYLTTKGIATDSDMEAFIGALVVIAGEAWSFWEKRHAINGTQPPTKPTNPPETPPA
ncbi:MAG: hypothetical protein E6R03_01590 [Hyphomicrobiaceae bacterium]|nr:MAG: hypothetical protein E6R03_01590 [Hyphomicrobiaceae bacterium]